MNRKAFVFKFSEDLALEYNPFGIRVQCVLPSFVATKMSGIKRSSMLAPSPADFARGTMKSWGLEVSSAGYWFHKLQVKFIHFESFWVSFHFYVTMIMLVHKSKPIKEIFTQTRTGRKTGGKTRLPG